MDDQRSESESTPPPANDISCQRCKLKKTDSEWIRCNRNKPTCGKCESLGVECDYVARRRGQRRNQYDKPIYDDGHESQLQRRKLGEMLQQIFNRLNRLEGLIVAGPSQAPIHFETQLNTPVRTPSILENDRTTFNTVLYLVIEISNIARDQLAHGPCQSTSREIQALLSTLPQTVHDLQEQLSARRQSSKSNSWSIPKEKSKKWVNYWLDHVGIETSILHSRRDFIVSIPDLLENPHVNIDLAMQMYVFTRLERLLDLGSGTSTYLNLVYIGMAFDADQDAEQGHYTRQIFCQILALIPLWEHENTGTPMDFLASFLTVFLALSFSEPDIGYKMLSHACKIGQNLGLFQVDLSEKSQTSTMPISPEGPHSDLHEKDRQRITFWSLLYLDCIFRLRFKKPALIQQGTWMVKIPSVVDHIVHKVGFDPQQFIVCTKTTLVVMRFFDLIEHEPLPPDVGHKICSLVEEINSIAANWKLEKSKGTVTDVVGRNLYLEQLFNSYININIFCSYRPELSRIPELRDHSIKSAREAFNLLTQMVETDTQSTWQTSVRSSSILTSYLTIYQTILLTSDVARSAPDIDSVIWLESTLENWIEEHEEIAPLHAAIKGLNKIVQFIVASRKLSPSMSPPELLSHPNEQSPLTASQRLPPLHVLEQKGFHFYSHPQL